jgi:hypothetical protein
LTLLIDADILADSNADYARINGVLCDKLVISKEEIGIRKLLIFCRGHHDWCTRILMVYNPFLFLNPTEY